MVHAALLQPIPRARGRGRRLLSLQSFPFFGICSMGSRPHRGRRAAFDDRREPGGRSWQASGAAGVGSGAAGVGFNYSRRRSPQAAAGVGDRGREASAGSAKSQGERCEQNLYARHGRSRTAAVVCGTSSSLSSLCVVVFCCCCCWSLCCWGWLFRPCAGPHMYIYICMYVCMYVCLHIET